MKYFRLPRWIHKPQSAFTLVETCVVVMLLSIVLFLTGSHATFLHRLLVRTELEHLYTTCYYLQRKAMITQKAQKLTFELDKQAYRYGMNRHYLPTHVRFGCLDGVQGPPASPAKLITNPITFKDNAISFAPSGVLQAGTVYLCDIAGKHGLALTSGVAQVSYLRKYQYTGQWELL